jgi:predicted phosphodiesterase
MTTRLAIFSDVHANLPAIEVVAEHIRRVGYDGVYCLGDLGGYAASRTRCRRSVRGMGCPTVLGNYDEGVGFEKEDCGCHYVKPFDIEMSDVSFRWTREHTSDANKAWLRELPREIRLEIGGRRVLLCHGSPRSTTSICSRPAPTGSCASSRPAENTTPMPT